jgi:hypothetical protein
MLLAGVLSGCETLHNAGVPGFDRYIKDEAALAAPEYREKFQVDRDAQAFTWLLRNRVRAGMSVMEVNEALGEAGEEFGHTDAIKKNTDGYQATDVGYRWGPDNNGRSVILFFREGHLVNYNPNEVTQAQ